jgi:hypothetical protein
VHEELSLVHVVRQAAWTASAYGSTAVRVALRGNGPRARSAEHRLVFVVGSPRSGTTFAAGALGSQPGWVDLGEVPLLKAAIPGLLGKPPDEQAQAIGRILQRVRTLGLARGMRGVEQTPETAFVLEGALGAYPQATALHMLRDGRDAVCSLLERGWLSAARTGADDARQAYGAHARFWVEPERRDEFVRVSDARRAAWAWRRYVTAARAVPDRTVEVRYETLVSAPDAEAERVAGLLDTDAGALRAAFRNAHADSVGRWRNDLTAEQLADVGAEAGSLLAELGYG